jgi:hypothetical protein
MDLFSLTKAAGTSELSYALQGQLYASGDGWLLLRVPNALVRGLFAALVEPGLELPPYGDEPGMLNAHISVMRPEELESLGGVDKITERGRSYHYTTGALRTFVPAGWPAMSRVWALEIRSPELEALRRSYGLSSLPHDNKYAFHVTVAVRRKHVLRENDLAKQSELLADVPDYSQLCVEALPKSAEFYTRQELLAARKATDTDPSEAQQAAGNYAKGKISWQGLTISLENPKGSTRSGTAPDGTSWSTTMQHDYGYFLGSEGNDGDHVDVFLGPTPASELVFVADQIDPATGKFDEHKVLVGFTSRAEAEAGYLANYSKGWQGLGQLVAFTVPQFKAWLASGDQQRRAYGQAVKLSALLGRHWQVPDGCFPVRELAKGRQDEMEEHTDSPRLATEIAKDHLSEDPQYYTHLEQAEKAAAEPAWRGSLRTQLFSPTWQAGEGVLANLGHNVTEWKGRAQQMLQGREQMEAWHAAQDPHYGWQRLRAILGGQLAPGPTDPVDQYLSQLPR